jgi:hypothetical protein
MAKIKFSHNYFKLPVIIKPAVLLAVHRVKLEKLPKDFIDYDTAYSLGKGAETGYYPLPEKGDYILLLLWGQRGLFTTLRRWTPDKQAYYEKLEGETIEVVIDAPL